MGFCLPLKGFFIVKNYLWKWMRLCSLGGQVRTSCFCQPQETKRTPLACIFCRLFLYPLISGSTALEKQQFHWVGAEPSHLPGCKSDYCVWALPAMLLIEIIVPPFPVWFLSQFLLNGLPSKEPIINKHIELCTMQNNIDFPVFLPSGIKNAPQI